MANRPSRPAGRPSRRYSQAGRLHDLIRLLEARNGATVEELAEECGVTRRTVYRDLQAIEAAGYPLMREPAGDERGRVVYRFLTGFSRIPPHHLFPARTDDPLPVPRSARLSAGHPLS